MRFPEQQPVNALSLDGLEQIEKALSRHRHLAKAREFVNRQPSAILTLAATARAIGVSPSHLSRLFQKELGTSFHHWLTLRRIQLATTLIREKPITAYEAAALCGFASYRSFARAFKSVVGLPPSTYRKQTQQSKRR